MKNTEKFLFMLNVASFALNGFIAISLGSAVNAIVAGISLSLAVGILFVVAKRKDENS